MDARWIIQDGLLRKDKQRIEHGKKSSYGLVLNRLILEVREEFTSVSVAIEDERISILDQKTKRGI